MPTQTKNSSKKAPAKTTPVKRATAKKTTVGNTPVVVVKATPKAASPKRPAHPDMLVPEEVLDIKSNHGFGPFKHGVMLSLVDLNNGDVLHTTFVPELTERQALLNYEMIFDDTVIMLENTEELANCVGVLFAVDINNQRR